MIKKLREEFRYNFNDLVAGQVMFESFTINDLNWLALLFQTGYLTIRAYDPVTGLYRSYRIGRQLQLGRESRGGVGGGSLFIFVGGGVTPNVCCKEYGELSRFLYIVRSKSNSRLRTF